MMKGQPNIVSGLDRPILFPNTLFNTKSCQVATMSEPYHYCTADFWQYALFRQQLTTLGQTSFQLPIPILYIELNLKSAKPSTFLGIITNPRFKTEPICYHKNKKFKEGCYQVSTNQITLLSRHINKYMLPNCKCIKYSKNESLLFPIAFRDERT